MKLKEDVKARWLEALRSGEYEQGRRKLRRHDGENAYCCLGVLCDLASKAGVGEWVDDGAGWKFSVGDPRAGDWSHTTLPPSVAAWAFEDTDIPGASFTPDDPPVRLERRLISLAAMNDAHNTFAQIADAIEEDL